MSQGSAVPSLVLESKSDADKDDERLPFFLEARDAILNAIKAAEKQEEILQHLSEDNIGYFDRLGRRLQPDEAIEFVVKGRSDAPRLDRNVRRRLLLASNKIKELSEDLVVHGFVPEVDKEEGSFHLLLYDGRKVKGPMKAQHVEPLVEAFNEYENKQRVLIQGVGVTDRQGNLLRVDGVEHVALLDPLDVPARLDELRLLRDGWLNGEGKRLDAENLDWFGNQFSSTYSDNLPLPRIFPTPEGALQLEWRNAKHDASLEVDLSTHKGHWHICELHGDQESEQELDLENPDDWETLESQIEKYFGDKS